MATKKTTTTKTVEKTETKKGATFTKAQLLNSTKYANRRDALNVVLDDNGNYTISDVETLLDRLMKGKVK